MFYHVTNVLSFLFDFLSNLELMSFCAPKVSRGQVLPYLPWISRTLGVRRLMVYYITTMLPLCYYYVTTILLQVQGRVLPHRRLNLRLSRLVDLHELGDIYIYYTRVRVRVSRLVDLHEVGDQRLERPGAPNQCIITV